MTSPQGSLEIERLARTNRENAKRVLDRDDTIASLESSLQSLREEIARLTAQTAAQHRVLENGAFDMMTLKYYGHMAVSNADFKALVQRAETAEAALLLYQQEHDKLPPSLATSLDLYRESPEVWHAEWRREHEFKVNLIQRGEDLEAKLTACQQENKRLLTNPTIRQLNDLWLREEQEAIDALQRAEAAEAQLTACHAAIDQIVGEMRDWPDPAIAAVDHKSPDREIQVWTERLSLLTGSGPTRATP